MPASTKKNQEQGEENDCSVIVDDPPPSLNGVESAKPSEEKDLEEKKLNGFSPKFDEPAPRLEGVESAEPSEKEEKKGEIMALGKRPSRMMAALLSILLVGTGSVNTLAAKWADEVEVDGVAFNHPFFQADVMFVGEMTCMVAYFISLYVQRYQWRKRHATVVSPVNSGDALEKGSQSSDTTDKIPSVPRFNYFLFAVPALCDVIATSIQYLGLSMTSAASYQMLRGAVIIFTGLAAMLFLRARLQLFRWMGMILVVVGLVIVGVADFIWHKDDDDSHTTSDIVVGDVLIIVAQIVVSIQMVVEQKLLSNCDIPALLAVGFEGIFGFLILSIAMIPMYYIHVGDTFSKLEENRLEDAIDAFHMMKESGLLVGSLCTTIVSIAFFNFAGISVTKFMSATTRMVLDSVRTIIIWIVSCAVPYFKGYFIPLQILGFVFLILGMFIYNDIFIMPYVRQSKYYAKVFPSWYEEARLEREKAAKEEAAKGQ